jgi:hypothetical protein
MKREYLVWYDGTSYIRYSGIDSCGKKEISKLYKDMRNTCIYYQERSVLLLRTVSRKEEVSLK